MEAFRGRGQLDFFASHDLEDFIAIVDGRTTGLEEIQNCAPDLRDYLAQTATLLLNDNRFLDALPGYVLEQERVPLITQRLKVLARGSANPEITTRPAAITFVRACRLKCYEAPGSMRR